MTSAMRFSTALRQHVRNKIEQMDHADIVGGVPSFSSAQSIENVLKMIFKGIKRHYPDHRAFIVVSDGGSTDDTREVARLVDPKSYNIDSIVTIYRGLPGKGSGLRAVLEIAAFLKARAVAFFDSALMSITPEWIKSLTLLHLIITGINLMAPLPIPSHIILPGRCMARRYGSRSAEILGYRQPLSGITLIRMYGRPMWQGLASIYG